jgi:uncharacterized protein YggE
MTISGATMLKKIVLLVAFTLAPLAGASQLPDYPFIHTSGSAQRYFMPDAGAVDFDVSASDTDPEAARALVDKQIAAISALLEAQGLSGDDVQIRDVHKDIRKADGNAVAAPLYDVRCKVHVNVRALAKWRDVVGPLINMPNLTNFYTEFSSSERDKIEGELIAMAVKDARRRADAIADGLGKKISGVAAVSNGALRNLGAALGLVTDNFRNSGAATNRVPTEKSDVLNIEIMKMGQPVDVIFRIK